MTTGLKRRVDRLETNGGKNSVVMVCAQHKLQGYSDRAREAHYRELAHVKYGRDDFGLMIFENCSDVEGVQMGVIEDLGLLVEEIQNDPNSMHLDLAEAHLC